MSLIPFATEWVGIFPKSYLPLSFYFFDMFLASLTFHLMYVLIQREKGEKLRLDLRSVLSLVVYLPATVLGGFRSTAAFILIVAFSLWWILPNKKKH